MAKKQPEPIEPETSPADAASVEPETSIEVADDETPVETKAAFVVRALASFHDALTKRDYKPGDLVPWDYLRAEKYVARGLVAIEE